jgi:hypothetical protein
VDGIVCGFCLATSEAARCLLFNSQFVGASA